MTPADAFLKGIVDGVRPDQRIYVDEWAEANRVLPADTPEPGPFRNARTPYLIDIQRTMSPGSPYREGWFQKPHQIGGSVTGENLIGSWICTAAGSILLVFPTLDDAKQWELTRFEPMRANTAALRRRVRSADLRGADNTKLRKKFPGGVMRLIGANRVGALKSSTIRYVKFEEPDEYILDLNDQGSPVDLAIKRTSNFGRKAKIYGDGTPTIEGRSAINKQVMRGDQRRWNLHCPSCGHAQPLKWDALKWVDGDTETAAYACSECGTLANEQSWKSRNYAARAAGMTEPECKAAGLAYWETTAAGEPGVASWYFSSLGAPIGWRPWPVLAREWTAAQGDEEKLKSFVNNYLGECWTDTVRAEVSANQLAARAEQYELMTCPQGGLVCVAGVDTQDNRLAIVVRVFGRGEESWGVWHSEIYGTPSSPDTWAKLAELLNAPIRHASGQVMKVDVAAVDAGGHHAEDVYAFCRTAQLRGKHWFAVRGASSYDAPKIGKPKKIEFTWRGKAVPGGVELRFVGTQAIKNLINGRLALAQPGGGYYHFPLAFQSDYYAQLRAERREWKRNRQGHKSLWWEGGGTRNEAWDCEVYCYAAFLYGTAGRHLEAVFRARELIYAPVVQGDLLVQTSAPGQTAMTPATLAADAASGASAPGADAAYQAMTAVPADAARPVNVRTRRVRRPVNA